MREQGVAQFWRVFDQVERTHRAFHRIFEAGHALERAIAFEPVPPELVAQ